MRRLAVAGGLCALAAGLIWANSPVLGIEVVWPFIVGLTLLPITSRTNQMAPTALGVGVGVAGGYLMFGVITRFFPMVPLVFGVGVFLALALLTLIGAARRKVFAIAGLFGGFGVFVGVYQPLWIAGRANFLSEATLAAATTLTALAAGMLVSMTAGRLAGVQAEAPKAERRTERRWVAERRQRSEDRRVRSSGYQGPERPRGTPDRRIGRDRRALPELAAPVEASR